MTLVVHPHDEFEYDENDTSETTGQWDEEKQHQIEENTKIFIGDSIDGDDIKDALVVGGIFYDEVVVGAATIEEGVAYFDLRVEISTMDGDLHDILSDPEGRQIEIWKPHTKYIGDQFILHNFEEISTHSSIRVTYEHAPWSLTTIHR